MPPPLHLVSLPYYVPFSSLYGDLLLLSPPVTARSAVFAPSELPEATRLYIIHRGIVVHGGRVLTSGKMWGEELLLETKHKEQGTIARCMTCTCRERFPRRSRT
jgi:hypothetical protein